MKSRFLREISGVSDEFYSDFKKLFSLSFEQFNDIISKYEQAKKSDDDNAFDEYISTLLEKHKELTASKIKSATNLLNFIKQTALSESLSADEVVEGISILLEKHIDNRKLTTEERAVILKFLSTDSEELYSFLKKKHLGKVLPELHSTTGVANLRIIKRDDEGKTPAYFPVCEILMEDTNDNKLAFEITEESLDKLIKSLQAFKDELDAVKDIIPHHGNK